MHSSSRRLNKKTKKSRISVMCTPQTTLQNRRNLILYLRQKINSSTSISRELKITTRLEACREPLRNTRKVHFFKESLIH